ncbi:NUDIX hydrolase [Mariniluteicoccus flavus]
MSLIRVSAVVLVDDDGRILTVRKRGTHRFMLPGGKPEAGESAAECAARECREEVGAVLDPAALRHLGRYTSDAANESDHRVEAEVFSHAAPTSVARAGEIDEVRWLDRSAPLPDDLAPLLLDLLPVLESPRSFGFSRSFGWGVVAISDPEATDVPGDLVDGPVTPAGHGLLVRVRHASDVEVPQALGPDDVVPPAQVAMRVHVDEPMPANPTWTGMLDLPSRSLVIGDADSEVELELDRPRCSVAVVLDPVDHATSLDLFVGDVDPHLGRDS